VSTFMPTQIAASHLSKTGDYTIPQGMEDKADLMFEVVLPQKLGKPWTMKTGLSGLLWLTGIAASLLCVCPDSPAATPGFGANKGGC